MTLSLMLKKTDEKQDLKLENKINPAKTEDLWTEMYAFLHLVNNSSKMYKMFCHLLIYFSHS